MRLRTPAAHGHAPHHAIHGGRDLRWFAGALVLALVVLLAVAAVAAAPGFALAPETGARAALLADAPHRGPGGPGLRGSALRAELARLRATTPFPPGAADRFPVRALEGVATGSVTIVIQERAACLWQRYWLRAHARDDTRGTAIAATVLSAAPGWEAFAPGQGNAHAGALAVAQRVAAGDAAGLQVLVDRGCSAVPAPR